VALDALKSRSIQLRGAPVLVTRALVP